MNHSLQATPKAPPPPAIPGLEQGNPQVSNRPAPAAPAQGAQPAGQAGQPVIPGPDGPRTAQEIRDQIRNDIQNSIRNGGDPQINFPDKVDFRNAVPEGAVIISVALFMSIAATIIFAPLMRAFARRMDAKSQGALSQSSDIGPRLAQLQESVDAMAMEVERITEAQRFQSKLLAERAKDPAALPR
jgi:hypothetical protein